MLCKNIIKCSGQCLTYTESSKRLCLPLLPSNGASLMAQTVKNLPAMRETWFDPWVGKIPGERNGYLLQYSCWENSMDRGSWQTSSLGRRESDKTEQLTQQHPQITICILGLINLNFKNFMICEKCQRPIKSKIFLSLTDTVKWLALL